MHLPAVRIVRRLALVNIFSADSFGHPKPLALMASLAVTSIHIAKRTMSVMAHHTALRTRLWEVFDSGD